MNELREDARSLIRAAVAEEREPSDSRRDALKRALLSQAALLGAGKAAAAPDALVGEGARALGDGAAASGSAVGGSALGAGGALGGGALGATALGGLFAKGAVVGVLVAGALHGVARFEGADAPGEPVPRVVSTESQTARAPRIAPTAPVTTTQTATPSPTALTTPLMAPPVAAVATAPLRASAEAAATPSLRDELALIAAAQAALRDGHAPRALELVDRHARLYPQGQLVQERLLAEALAGCQAGDIARGRRAAQAFLSRAPSSAMAARVRSACGLGSDSPR